MIDFATVKAAADGRWPEVLTYNGTPAEFFNGKHQPCPGCGGVDRARWDEQKQAFFCGQGGATTGGDGFSFMEHCGWSKSDALNAVATYLGIEKLRLTPREQSIIALRIRKARLADLEATLAHELHILYQTVTPRVNGRINAEDKSYMELHPEFRQPPDDYWAREIEAANNVHYLIEQLYKEAS